MLYLRNAKLYAVIGTLFYLVLSQTKLSACGYNFVGGCSTYIGLNINGTQDSFTVNPCISGRPFDGLQLGNIRNLSLMSARATTWESCINNVTNVVLYYRIYESGGTSGAWKTLTLVETSVQLEGPYTTRHREKYINQDLTQGLTTGRNYLMEVFYMAEVDTLGDDFIPETLLMQNNNGQNFKLSFQYGGPSAPPFTTVVTRSESTLCNGDSSGVAGVTVFGNAVDLRYSWSASPDNFYTIFHLPVGTYTVTVTAANANPQIRSIVIGQPTPVTATFSNIEPAGCNNSPGLATISASGGTPTYQYTWDSGTTGAIASIPSPGTWKVTVRDANNCKKTFSVQVPGNNTIAERNISTEICHGEVFISNGMRFTQTGQYQYSIPNAAGCDTIVHLNLHVIAADSAFVNLPDSAQIVCLSPSIDLCATAIAGAGFIWEKNNIPLSTNACYTATSGGSYILSSTLKGNSKTCTARKTVFIGAKLLPPAVEIKMAPPVFNCRADSAEVVFSALTPAQKPVYEWKLNEKVVSTQANCLIKLPVAAWASANLHLNLADEYGCQVNYASPEIAINPPAPLILSNTTHAASGATKADGNAETTAFGGTPPYRYLWSNGSTTARMENVLPGGYCVTIMDANNCAIKGCVQITYTIAAHNVMLEKENGVRIFPNPLTTGTDLLTIQLPDVLKEKDMPYTLSEASGVLMHRGILQPQQSALSLPADLPEGIYIFTLQTDYGPLPLRIFVTSRQ